VYILYDTNATHSGTALAMSYTPLLALYHDTSSIIFHQSIAELWIFRQSHCSYWELRAF